MQLHKCIGADAHTMQSVKAYIDEKTMQFTIKNVFISKIAMYQKEILFSMIFFEI